MHKKITDFAKKQLKESIMNPNGNTDRNRHAETIIRTHVVWSMGASFFVTLPVADVFAVSALQLDMIRQLTRVYDIDFAETQGKAIISALTSSTMARAGARSLIKLIPGIGTVVGGITTAAVNGAGTYALGEVFKQHFANGGTILDFDTDRLKKVYQEQFEKGKKVAKQWKEEAEAKVENLTNEAPQPSDPAPGATRQSAKSTPTPEPTPEPPAPVMDDNAIRKIKELAEMKAQNIISEEEFELMKKRIIG